MGMRIYSDVAIDDFSLSPECFGLNIPIDKLDGYNYWDPRLPTNKQTHRDFINKSCKSYEIFNFSNFCIFLKVKSCSDCDYDVTN